MPLQPAKRILDLVVLVIVLAAAARCAPLELATLPIGTPVGEEAFRRAAKEFSCPTDKINLVRRDDVLPDLFDIEACGNRARYNCPHNECLREPDPARWDPDPVLCRNPDAIKAKSIKCVKPYKPYSPYD